MTKLVHIVVLVAWFTEPTGKTYGKCNDGELQTFVYCRSTNHFNANVSCRVEGIAMINNITIDQQNRTKACKGKQWHSTYGNSDTTVWVANKCSAVFEVCGEAIATTNSETVVPSMTSSATQTASTSGRISTDQADSSTTASSITSHSVRTTETTKDVLTTDPGQATTISLPLTPEMTSVVTEIDTMLSKTTETATIEHPFSTKSVSTTSDGTASMRSSSSTTFLMSTKPMSTLTTSYGLSLNAASTTGSSSF